MKALHLLVLAVAFSSVSTSIASAHSSTPRVDRRQYAQHLRMRDGVRDGQLTPRERARLRSGQAHVRRLERRAIRDGSLTLRERRQLDRMQDRQSRRITRMRHNSRSI